SLTHPSRCDRQLPICSLCQRTGQQCEYPRTRLKPGPKPGSTNPRRRQQFSGFRNPQAPHPKSVDAVSPDWARCRSRSLQELNRATCQPPPASVASSSSPPPQTPDMMALNFAKAISISSLFHPSHEGPPDSQREQTAEPSPGFLLLMAGVQEKLTKACNVLKLSIHQAQSLIDLHFEAVAGLRAFSLFHQPTFSDKVRDIGDHNHLIALFAAMFSISSRWSSTTPDDPAGALDSSSPPHQEFHRLSLTYINLSLDACTNTPPSLCLLQAMTLAGFYKLVTGVDGPAWRWVGSAIRVAYELRLHLIDYEGLVEAPTSETELREWSSNEERRRCWWALWEMDIFASTIQRAPTAIDGNMNETFLPVSDDFWFAGKYQASCLVRGGPEERWQRLKASGNQDCFAWCIVLSSLMRDAQVLSRGNIQGIFSSLEPKNNVSKLARYFSHGHKRKTAEENSQQLANLVRAYHALLDNLPENLRHRGEPLTFGIDEANNALASRRSSAEKYNTRMLAVSAHFMIYQNYVFAGIVDGSIPLSFLEGGEEQPGLFTAPHQAWTFSVGLKKLLDTSETVLDLLESCPKGHARYVSPYYASTIWIAAALQIFKGIAMFDDDPIRTRCKYTALREAYLEFHRLWGTPLTLLQSLDSLQARLRLRQQELATSAASENAAQTSDQQPQNGRAAVDDADTGTTTAGQAPPCPSAPDPEESPFRSPMPPFDDVAPMMGSWSSSGEVPDWLAAADPSTGHGISQDAWKAALPDEAMLDNFAWYSSDIMIELSQGYS
ncbi:fungal-specific transcription factor domain-containing protein, partial [Coniochaeta sp. 2T2.1]